MLRINIVAIHAMLIGTMQKSFIATAVCVLSIFFVHPTQTDAATRCSQYTGSSNTPRTTLGAPYDLFDTAKTLLFTADCTDDTLSITLGNTKRNHLMYSIVYAEFEAGQYTPLKLTTTNNRISSTDWLLINTVQGDIAIPQSAQGKTINIYAYMCQVRVGAEGKSLKCGCNENNRDTCMNQHGTHLGTWNHQRVTLPSSSGTREGGENYGVDTLGPDVVEDAWRPPYDVDNIIKPVDPVPYLEKFDLPSCNSSDAFIIDSNSDWGQINSSQYRVFCVKPGDYRGVGRITLTADGSSSKPRVIRLLNSNVTTDRHIVNIGAGDLARVKSFYFKNADHWIIDRMFISYGEAPPVQFHGSSNNIINGMRLENEHSGVLFHHGSHYNMFQNGYVYRRGVGENVCFHWPSWFGPNGMSPVIAKHNAVVNNEIRDCGDGFQPQTHGVRNGKDLKEEFDGTKIIANDIYLTSDKYADCSTGRRTPSGKCACAENAVDIKVGGSAAHPMIVKGNTMWGWRQAVKTCDGKATSHSDWGNAMHAHQVAKDIIVEDNIMFDSDRGYSSVRHAKNVVVRNNLFYNIKDYPVLVYHDTTNCSSFRGFGNTSSCVLNNFTITNNVIHGGRNWFSGGTIGPTNSRLSCNVVLDAGGAVGKKNGSTQVSQNSFYDASAGTYGGSGDVRKSGVSAARHDDVCVTTRFFSNPTKKCFNDVKPTGQSPHACTGVGLTNW